MITDGSNTEAKQHQCPAAGMKLLCCFGIELSVSA